MQLAAQAINRSGIGNPIGLCYISFLQKKEKLIYSASHIVFLSTLHCSSIQSGPVMDAAKPNTETLSHSHVLALPYPGRGHINPMMNLCKLLVSSRPRILITFVVTEEWLTFICSEPKPDNVRFCTLPNVIPSELFRAKDFPGFLEAVNTRMEAPFDELLDTLEHPVSAIIADTYMRWAVGVGNRRNIPVASFWPMSASVFSVFHHFDLLVKNGHILVEHQLSERRDEIVDYIPGLPATRLTDLPTILFGSGTAGGRQTLQRALQSVSDVSKARYLLFTSVYQLEAQVIDALKAKLPFPVYPFGPTIPYLDLKVNCSTATGLCGSSNYLQWLDSQPSGSVLYVSLGSFLSVSSAQMDEIVAGVRSSGVRYSWVSRGDTFRFRDGADDVGIVVPWCDQLRVLCHSSTGGFWTHCGWNSTLEGAYAGVPMLTFPIFMDQVPNSKQIVEDWKIGWRVREVGRETLVTREEISEQVKRFMDLDSYERKEMSQRARKLQEIFQGAVAEGGSSMVNVDAFLKDISQ